MIIYGKNVVREAIYAKREIYKLWIDEKFVDFKFLDFLKQKNIRYEKKEKHFLNEKTNNNNHQGIVADVRPYEYYNLEDVIKDNYLHRFIILDGIEDPHNLGAIIRTAEATKIDGIIISKKNQIMLNSTVAKVSSGAIEHVKVILVNNLVQAIKKLKENNIWVIGTDGSTTTEYQNLDISRSLAVVLGSEGQGMRHLIKKECDDIIKIPMYGKVNSLNVSVAAALIMYKMV